MKNMMFITTLSLLSLPSLAHNQFTGNELTPIYADLSQLKKSSVPVLFADENSQMGYTVATSEMLNRLSASAHHDGRCGNFEALAKIPSDLTTVKNDFLNIQKQQEKNFTYERVFRNLNVDANPKVADAVAELNSNNIKETVTWLSGYQSRYNRGTNPNQHVQDFYNKLKTMTASLPYVTVDMIAHVKTPQKSVRVSIKGAERPNEIIVLGGHLDSISGWGFGNAKAPGADDNASGSSSLFEAFRVLITKVQPQRTVEFMWYAGEESGLLGSAEIAETYKTEKKAVIAVLQLDMTMFPGNGAGKIASMTDFTSPWLRDYLVSINNSYIHAEILEDQCGYGCSDHASWFRRGYPALMPTEARFNSMFQSIHTERDVITPESSFEHALIFSKIALIMAMDLGNSTLREPTL